MIRRRPPSDRMGRVIISAALAIFGIAALAIGLFWLAHPASDRFPGAPHRSELPGLVGVSFLVVPVVLIGIAGYRLWWTVTIDLEALRERRRRH